MDVCMYDVPSVAVSPCETGHFGANPLNPITVPLPQVEGRRCDRCMENTRSRDTGGFGEKVCEPCDDCYNLVQAAADQHRDNLAALESLLQQIADNPEPVGDDFLLQMRRLKVRVKNTLAEARIREGIRTGRSSRDGHLFRAEFSFCNSPLALNFTRRHPHLYGDPGFCKI